MAASDRDGDLGCGCLGRHCCVFGGRSRTGLGVVGEVTCDLGRDVRSCCMRKMFDPDLLVKSEVR